MPARAGLNPRGGDGLRIEWDVPIKMDDGLVLRADIFRPEEGRHPVILSYGPYAKGLAFQDGYPSAWQRMVAEHPDVAYGSSNQYQSWEVVDPEKWVPDGYACVRVDSRGAGRSARVHPHARITVRNPFSRVDHLPILVLVGRTVCDVGVLGNHSLPS